MEVRKELMMKPTVRKDLYGTPYPWKSFTMASTITQVSDVDGTQITSAYANLAGSWLNTVIDAAEKNLVGNQAFGQYLVPEGQNFIEIPYISKRLGTWQSSSEEYTTADTEIEYTQLNNNDGVNLSPTWENYGVALTEKSVYTSNIAIIEHARRELAYKVATTVDDAIFTALDDATIMSNTVAGMQTIFGGDATDADDTLDAGDILTTDLIAKAKRLLRSSTGYYWNSNAWTASAFSKNPWPMTPDEPFLLFVGPEQMESLETDSQFTNAAEYGGREVVLNGEFGTYLGVKVLSTNAVPQLLSSATNPNFTNGTGSISTDVTMRTCFMVKAQRCGALAFGPRPRIHVWMDHGMANIKIRVVQAYAADTVHHDGIVKIAVSDE